jgi:sugar (pentulose or hexulose) kinase
MDKRCSHELLQKFNKDDSTRCNVFAGTTVHNGYGCATLAWMLENNEPYFDNYDACGTVGDFLVWLLTLNSENNKVCLIAPTNAASFGAYAHAGASWDSNLLNRISPKILKILPKVTNEPIYQQVSSNGICHLSNGVKVGICEGDAASSLYAMLHTYLSNPLDYYTTACISMGTSCQFSLLVKRSDLDSDENLNFMRNRSIEYRPYVLHDESLKDSLILVCASMNGGGVWKKFVDDIARHNPSEKIPQLHQKLMALGVEALHSAHQISEFADAFVRQFFEKERYQSRGEYELQQQRCRDQTQLSMPLHFDINTNREIVAEITHALAKQIFRNLEEMVFCSLTAKEHSLLSNIRGILIAGGALQQSPLLVQSCEMIFKIPVYNRNFDAFDNKTPDAALGAASIEEKLLQNEPI